MTRPLPVRRHAARARDLTRRGPFARRIRFPRSRDDRPGSWATATSALASATHRKSVSGGRIARTAPRIAAAHDSHGTTPRDSWTSRSTAIRAPRSGARSVDGSTDARHSTRDRRFPSRPSRRWTSSPRWQMSHRPRSRSGRARAQAEVVSRVFAAPGTGALGEGARPAGAFAVRGENLNAAARRTSRRGLAEVARKFPKLRSFLGASSAARASPPREPRATPARHADVATGNNRGKRSIDDLIMTANYDKIAALGADRERLSVELRRRRGGAGRDRKAQARRAMDPRLRPASRPPDQWESEQFVALQMQEDAADTFTARMYLHAYGPQADVLVPFAALFVAAALAAVHGARRRDPIRLFSLFFFNGRRGTPSRRRNDAQRHAVAVRCRHRACPDAVLRDPVFVRVRGEREVATHPASMYRPCGMRLFRHHRDRVRAPCTCSGRGSCPPPTTPRRATSGRGSCGA